MVDKLQHLDGRSAEIHNLVETVPLNQMVETANAKQYCPKCAAVSLLEWAAFAAIRAGATAGEVTSAIANGTVMAEEETNGWRRSLPLRYGIRQAYQSALKIQLLLPIDPASNAKESARALISVRLCGI